MSLERIGLQDLQDLAESFANLNVVDLKVNEVPKTERDQIPPQGNPGVHFEEEHMEYNPEAFRRNVKDGSGPSGRRRRQRQKLHDTPVGKATLEPIHPYGLTLNIDEAEFKDRETLIDDWGIAMKITATTLELDRVAFIKTMKLSWTGIVKDSFDSTSEEDMQKLWGREDENDLGLIVDRAVRALKSHFIGEGFYGFAHNEKSQMYKLAFYNLRLVVLTQETLSQFLKLFTLYWHKSAVDGDLAKELFFLKFPSPWREELMKGYTPGDKDNTGRRMSYAQKKLSDWCIEFTRQRDLKRLRKSNKSGSLICSNVALETEIGGDQFQTRRKKNRFQPYRSREGRKSSWKPLRTRWSKQKAGYYKSGRRSGPGGGRYSSQGGSTQCHDPTT